MTDRLAPTVPRKETRPWFKWYPKGVDPYFVPQPSTILDRLTRSFDRYGDLCMIEYYGKEYSYAQMRALVGRAGAALRAQGIGPGDRVALLLPNCPWHPIFFFATLSIGAVVTQVSPLDAEREIQHKLHDSGAKLVVSLTTPEFSSRFEMLLAEGDCPPLVMCDDPVSAMGRECPVIDGAMSLETFWADHDGAPYQPVHAQPSDVALLQFTGGTTGVPKAAVLTHDNLAAASQMYSEMGKTDSVSKPGKPWLLYSPLFHIMGLSSSMLKRVAEGGTLCLRLRFDPEVTLREIQSLKIAALGGVPTTWIALLATKGIDTADLSSLEYVGSGGAPLPVEVYNRVKGLTGLKIRGGWGMTETSPAGTTVPRDMPDEKLGTIGLPLPGLDIRIVDVDDPHREQPSGTPGEMAIRGPNVTSHYWNRPDDTAAAFVDGWFLTGDIGFMDDDGWFYIVDRKKDMILSGGFNVFPLVIENAVHAHPDVAEALVIGVPDAYRGESAKVFVVLNAGAPRFTLEALQDFLGDKLGRHEVPRHLEFRTELPRTSVGKPDRKALKAEEKALRVTV